MEDIMQFMEKPLLKAAGVMGSGLSTEVFSCG